MARKIFVGSLPQNISEDELRHEFDAFGDVEEQCAKDNCPPGKQWAFITYGTSDEALAAKEACDRKLVFPESERPCDVMLAKNQGIGGSPGATPEASAPRKIFVGSLPDGIEALSGFLQEMFLKQGCESGRQWGFVTFATAEEAQFAQEQTNGILMFETSLRPCEVIFARNQGLYGSGSLTKTAQPSPSSVLPIDTGPKKIFVGTLPDNAMDAKASCDRTLMLPGAERPCEVTIAKHQGMYGQDADGDGGRLATSTSSRSSYTPLSSQVFVGSLPDGCPEHLLRQEFSRYGQITDVFMKQGCEPGRQWAFIIFSSAEEAMLAKESTDKILQLPGASRACEVMLAKNQGMYGQAPLRAFGLGPGMQGLPGQPPPPTTPPPPHLTPWRTGTFSGAIRHTAMPPRNAPQSLSLRRAMWVLAVSQRMEEAVGVLVPAMHHIEAHHDLAGSMQVPRQGWSQWPSAPQAQVVHQVMAHNGQMHNVQVAPKAAPFPPLPVSLSRQQMPDRDPGSFTPPAAGVGSFVGRVPDGTPTSRAKSPAQPQGLLVRAGKSPPRMPGPKSSLGLPSSASARNTPKPQPRPVVSFAPVRSPSPGQRPSREEEGRSPSPDRKGQRDPSCGKDARPDGRIRADFRDACEEAHSGAHSGSRTSRHSEAETIPEEPHYDAERAARERELLAMQESQPLRCEKLRAREQRVAEREADLVAREKRAQARELKSRCADLDCRSADLDQREVRLKAEEDRHRDLKRSLDERDARWHEAAKDATMILKPHLKPRLGEVSSSDAKNVALSLLAEIAPRKHPPATSVPRDPVMILALVTDFAMPPTCSECGSTDVEVQRGVHTCCACGAALENLGCELLRGNLHKKLEVKRHDHHLMRLKQINRNAVLMQVRQQKWRAALGKLCGILRLQPAIQDAALRLVQHTCSRGFRGSKERHKLLGCACLLVAASKHNIGVDPTC
eukprot:g8808.t1